MTTCSVDWKAYVLGEMDRGESAEAEAHAGGCQSCREELEQLRLMQVALRALPEEEIPQRIAFVSDRVFEPRWWRDMWRSGPAMGFASAVVLALAIVAYGFARPVIVPARTASIDTARIEQRIEEEAGKRAQAVVAKAVAGLEARNAAQMAQAIQTAEKRAEVLHQAELAEAQETVRLYQQQMGRLLVAWNEQGDGR